jgi:hypothetical protein
MLRQRMGVVWCDDRRNDVKKTVMTLAKEGKGGEAQEASKASDGNEADDEEDEEAKLLRQMEELNAKMAQEKRSKKKAAQKLVRGVGIRCRAHDRYTDRYTGETL